MRMGIHERRRLLREWKLVRLEHPGADLSVDFFGAVEGME